MKIQPLIASLFLVISFLAPIESRVKIDTFNGKKLYFNSTEASLADHKAACARLGMELASATTKQELEFIVKESFGDEVWIGKNCIKDGVGGEWCFECQFCGYRRSAVCMDAQEKDVPKVTSTEKPSIEVSKVTSTERKSKMTTEKVASTTTERPSTQVPKVASTTNPTVEKVTSNDDDGGKSSPRRPEVSSGSTSRNADRQGRASSFSHISVNRPSSTAWVKSTTASPKVDEETTPEENSASQEKGAESETKSDQKSDAKSERKSTTKKPFPLADQSSEHASNIIGLNRDANLMTTLSSKMMIKGTEPPHQGASRKRIFQIDEETLSRRTVVNLAVVIGFCVFVTILTTIVISLLYATRRRAAHARPIPPKVMIPSSAPIKIHPDYMLRAGMKASYYPQEAMKKYNLV